MSAAPFRFSVKSNRTPESPISYFMEQAIENPTLISLAAGLVDSQTLPVTPIAETVAQLLADPQAAKMALQYGTTQGYSPLRDRVLRHVTELDGVTPKDVSLGIEDVMVTTGSQQLLYMLSEILFDSDDIVITEAPSYFVFHSVLAGTGVKVLAVPMDEDGMQIDQLAKLLEQLDRTGEIAKVKMIYTVDYFQNPTGLSLSKQRRQELFACVQKYQSRSRILIMEDAAYRELRYEGEDIPSIKSLDKQNQFVIYAGTFSKPCSPGLKTGYALMPAELIEPLVRIKGNHDFGSCNLAQHVLNRLMQSGVYHQHVQYLQQMYRLKRDAMLQAFQDYFGSINDVKWTHPKGGMFIWLTMPSSCGTGPGQPFLNAAIQQGVLYIPGEFGYVGDDSSRPKNEARISFGDAGIEQIKEGIHRLRQAYDLVREGKPVPDMIKRKRVVVTN